MKMKWMVWYPDMLLHARLLLVRPTQFRWAGHLSPDYRCKDKKMAFDGENSPLYKNF